MVKFDIIRNHLRPKRLKGTIISTYLTDIQSTLRFHTSKTFHTMRGTRHTHKLKLISLSRLNLINIISGVDNIKNTKKISN